MKLSLRLTPFFALALASLAIAQDPVVGAQTLITVDNTSNSVDETSSSASTDGLEIIGGFNDYRNNSSVVRSSFGISSDGGASWGHIILRPPAANQTSVEGDPMAAYDARTNTLFAGAMAFGGNGGIYVARKNPGANTFTGSVMARVSGSVDKGWMACGPIPGNPNTSRLYITYNQGVIWSNDLGNTWTAPIPLGSRIGYLPRVGPAGEVYVSSWDFGLGHWFRRSMDGGQTWSADLKAVSRLDSWGIGNGRIPGTFRNPQLQAMAVNPINGNLVIVWFDTTNIVNNQRNLDLYITKSIDKGVTWSAPLRLPFRPLNTIGDMIFPWVEFSREGRLHLLTFDSSYTANQVDGVVNGFWDQVYAYSDDEGATWSQKFRLTPQSFNSANDGTGFSFLGDYNGMGFSDNHAWPVYLDTTPGKARGYTNRVYTPIYAPSNFSFFRGQLVSGNLASLFLKDGNSMVGKPGIVGNQAEAPIQLETGVVGIVNTNPTQMKVHLWASVSSVNIQQQVLMFNINTQQFDVLDTRAASLVETNTVVNVANPANYITPATGTVRWRVAYKPVGPVSNPNWTATFNQDVLLLYY